MKTIKSRLDEIIDCLNASPLFQLSLSSIELFHSNFLGWLCGKYPQIPESFFLKRTSAHSETVAVSREEHKIDLTLKFHSSDIVIIENKVKSLASKEQLREYSNKFLNHRDKSKIHFFLLSLVKPDFLRDSESTIEFDNGFTWQYISYDDLSKQLSEILPELNAKDCYHVSLVKDYIDFINNLHELQYYFTIDWTNSSDDFLIAKADIEKLRKIRLHDLIEKLRYAQLANRIKNELVAKRFFLVANVLDNGKPGEVQIESGMTHSMGLFDLKYCVSNDRCPVILGIQIQGNSFRLVVEAKNPHIAKEVAKILRQPTKADKLWFDFGHFFDDSDEYPRNAEFNQFSGQFFYRAKKMKSIPPQNLVDIIVRYVEDAHDNQEIIQRRINASVT
jgi:hypothetical protein